MAPSFRRRASAMPPPRRSTCPTRPRVTTHRPHTGPGRQAASSTCPVTSTSSVAAALARAPRPSSASARSPRRRHQRCHPHRPCRPATSRSPGATIWSRAAHAVADSSRPRAGARLPPGRLTYPTKPRLTTPTTHQAQARHTRRVATFATGIPLAVSKVDWPFRAPHTISASACSPHRRHRRRQPRHPCRPATS